MRGGDLQPPVWLPRYDLAINLDIPGHTAHVVQQVSWVNRTNQVLSEIVFNVHTHYTPPKNVVDRMFIAKMLEIMRVAGRDGIYDQTAFELHDVQLMEPQGDRWVPKSLEHHYQADLETALVVKLPKPLGPGESVALSLSYAIRLPQKQGRWGQWKDVTFLSNWHPVVAFLDPVKGWLPTPFVPWHQPFFNEAGVYNVRIRLPDDQLIACSGSPKKASQKDGIAEYTVGPVVVRDWSMMCSNRYKEFTGEAGPVKVKCLAFPEHEHYAKFLVEKSSRAIIEYSRWFGAFPYPEFTVVETYFGWNGNECSDLVMIDERVFSMPHFAEGYVEYLISHEVGHQWWYNTIGTDGFRETFMDEAFATYFAHRLLNQFEGKNNSMLKFPKGLNWLPGIQREDYRYSQFYATLRNGELGPAVQEMTKYRHVGNLFSAAYDRGGKIVGMIEERLGEAAFMDFMKRIYAKYYFKVIRVDDFKRELEAYTGHTWDSFFHQWLHQNGMTDWAVEDVEVMNVHGSKNVGDKELYRAVVTVKQKADNTEPTTLGFSFDDGKTYTIRVPVSTANGPMTFDKPIAEMEPLSDNRVKLVVYLPAEPSQIAIDPDQVLPDSEPANNFWKCRNRYKLTPFYTMLDETAFTTAYDRWNFIGGPWFFGPSYADPWFTRASVMGLRAGALRTEEFNGGVYTGYRSTYKDIAVGFDALFPHFPFPRTELGLHAEKSLGQIGNQGDLDRGAIWLRHIIDESPSLYAAPMHHVEVFASWQQNFLPPPRQTIPNAYEFRQNTNVGVHYHIDLLSPYWDPDTGVKLDATYAFGIPIFGQERTSQQVTAQISTVQAPPEGLGWLSDTRLALRAFGAWATPRNARLLSLGGDMQFRGFDLAERQGSMAWVGSVEFRMPVWRGADVDVADHFIRLKNLYLAPFYDIGDASIDGHSLGPVAHAVGLGFRFDVAWFSFLERTMLRLDVAKTVNQNSPFQFWIGITHPF